MDNIINNLNLEKLNIKDLTILLEALNDINLDEISKNDDIEVI